jgi:hypothetical protein
MITVIGSAHESQPRRARSHDPRRSVIDLNHRAADGQSHAHAAVLGREEILK